MDVCQRKKFVLASGPRLCGKTLNCLHVLCDHAYSVKHANILILAPSQTAGLDSGIWDDLIDVVIPSFGLKVLKESYTHNISKKQFVEVENKFGVAVKIQLGSLKDERDVKKMYKNKRYSMIYVPELCEIFKYRRTFDILKDSLRALGVPDNQLLFLADTNPADEGDKSWIYQLWYVLLNADDVDDRLKPLQKGLGLVEFQITDNPYLSEDRKMELISSYAHDPDMFARYIQGKWVVSSEGALFIGVFKPNIHVIGDRINFSGDDPEIMVPEEDCIELWTGWDPGPTNCAFGIIEPWKYETEDKKLVTAFKCLDEQVVIGEDFDMSEFVLSAMEKMDYWENMIGRPVIWKHWSDQSALNMRESIANTYLHKEIFQISEGKIELQGAGQIQQSNMVRIRVSFWRRLLFQNRLFFSGRCRNVIDMNRSIKKGVGQYQSISKGSPHKHVFDCFSYPISMECFDEIRTMTLKNRRPRTETESGVVTIGM